jgi:hypothetical protein
MDIEEAGMTIKVSDPELLSDLQSVTDDVDLATPEGNVIGRFKPAAWGVPPPGLVSPFSERRGLLEDSAVNSSALKRPGRQGRQGV